MKKLLLSLTASLLVIMLYAQDSSRVTLYFLYGSKPRAGFRNVEKKWFGGLHGGHVSIGVDGLVIGFEPQGRCHVFPHRRRTHSAFISEHHSTWVRDTASLKYAAIVIPLSRSQYDTLKALHSRYLLEPPFDYAVFGMRCAAATYEILSNLGITRPKSRLANICCHFYPKPLRKKMLRLAEKRGYQVTHQPGRNSRTWEKDHFW